MFTKIKPRTLLISLAIIIFAVVAVTGGAAADRIFGFKPLDQLVPRNSSLTANTQNVKVINEESVAVDVSEKLSPSVVTVSIKTQQSSVLQFDPFNGFQRKLQGGVQQDIGTAFVVSSDGLIVTNKHVVSDTSATYKVIAKDNKEYDVKTINRDPANDLAILKIDATGLTPVELGDSSNLKVGQYVVAIGTALGEFRDTVTTGVISGLGRGITAGSAFEGSVEQLDDVIQTDAAINPGNSGGPLLNSEGQVIGINVAVAQGAQNIGFAIPVNVIKTALEQFQKTGSFASKPFLGVQYQIISRQTAILNNVPQGAYITDVVSGASADKAGILVDDIITKFDGSEVNDSEGHSLSDLISKKKVGDSVSVTIWRDGQTKDLTVMLGQSSQ